MRDAAAAERGVAVSGPAAAARMLVLMALAFGVGCREEPTIVIRFEPQDLATPRQAEVGAGRGPAETRSAPRDAGMPRDAPSPVAAVPSPRAPSPPGKAGSDEGTCGADTDCVVVKADCCGCSQGGKARAVARGQQVAAERELVRRCGPTTMCIQALSNDPSCRQRAACRQRRCVLVDGG